MRSSGEMDIGTPCDLLSCCGSSSPRTNYEICVCVSLSILLSAQLNSPSIIHDSGFTHRRPTNWLIRKAKHLVRTNTPTTRDSFSEEAKVSLSCGRSVLTFLVAACLAAPRGARPWRWIGLAIPFYVLTLCFMSTI